MTRGESWFLRSAHALAAVSGLIWAWMIFFPSSEDPYSPLPHPRLPQVHAIHVLAGAALLFAVGLIWRSHAWSRLRSGFRPRRRSGATLALLFLPMAASGTLLQVTVHETWRTVWSWLHLVVSAVWLAAWLVHRIRSQAPVVC
ncbi:MAG: hypothetical protein O3A20_03195 [Planctomycetota bacterium]|nr:hypothetical protein [Planctomycetota bacterium]